MQHAHALKEGGDLAGAVTSYRRAMALAPDEADTLLHLGALLRRMGQHPEASEHLHRATALGHADAAAMLALQRAQDELADARVRDERQRNREMVHLDHYRLVVNGCGQQAWIGTQPVEGTEAIDLHARPNFRAPGHCHNRFQVVWLFERLLSDLPDSQWPLLLDEAIRLIGEEGRLIVRHEQTADISLMTVRAALARRPGLTVTMEPHLVEDNRIINAIFTIRRARIEAYRDKSWSFIVLAQGDRTPNVLALLDRLKAAGKTVDHEVIIVGPRLEEYSDYDVFVFNKEYRRDYAQIGLKKNEAACFASNANLCIMHDRYVIDDNFFPGFDTFGYDFDIVAVSQRYQTGEPYPFYGELTGKPLIWSVPIHTENHQEYRPTHFVNGGFAVFKRATFEEIGYNSLLAWNEAEDVEITHAFATRHLPPRLNLSSTATTTASTAHTAMFLPDPSIDRSL